jgi:hypothetical protein
MDPMLPRCQKLMQHHYYFLFNKNNSRLVANLSTNNCFPHPRGIESSSKKSKERLPPFLRDNEDLHTKFVRHCTLNLADLSIDLAREFVIDTLIPEAFPLTENNPEHKDVLQRLYKMSETPSRSTIWEWMTHCGFSYKPRTKRFFVDTHESIPNRKYHKEQTARYLKRERLMHRWYQFTLEEAKNYEMEGLLIPGRGYRYKNEEGLEMVELHVDEIPDNTLLTRINNLCLYGGNLSVRKMPNERPVISFGHGECIFRQFIFTCSAWKGTKGEQAPIPKDDQLLRINAFRNEKQPNHTEIESAIKINGSAVKNPLLDSPFLIFLSMEQESGRRVLDI